ncbi:hypothetical protein GUJ93_ZPchr0010g7980 [Zizania palustris]|uniref:Uncharacterized protein n=1 Tax=Zizania palustris TaxID=103762 RepID=A0A8J5VVU2_ZIZPA|nr:hypothetical protein GUJ93_ZPchr0010g7980 [Zizania palustris]
MVAAVVRLEEALNNNPAAQQQAPGHGPLPAATKQRDNPPQVLTGSHQGGGRRNHSQADDENGGQGDLSPHHQGGGRQNPSQADDEENGGQGTHRRTTRERDD